jgi:hypothetical protein
VRIYAASIAVSVANSAGREVVTVPPPVRVF